MDTPYVETRRSRTAPLWFIGGFAAGAAALYFFDPQRGAARRNTLADQVVARGNEAVELTGKKARHLRNKAQGAIAERQAGNAADLEDTGTTGPQI